jgi:prepilin-type N-terminal cleavage/methylation domain-containing protein/prepilin-type processing-associated H-X9-DG protein
MGTTSTRGGVPVRSFTRDGSRGFTLVESLVVVAVIALLMGVLFPVIGAARGAARTAKCMTQQKGLHNETFAWAMSNKDLLPGVNTTGKQYLSHTTMAALCGDTSPTTPTSVFDWISPIMGQSMGLSANRAKRTAEIFEKLGCPESKSMNNALWGPAGVPDYADFEAIQNTTGFRQISYLSPASFHLLGKRGSGGSPWSSSSGGWHYPYRGPVTTPPGYTPRASRIGSPALKIWVADGTRYVAAPDVLDFDVNPRPFYYGSFTSSGPIYVGSTAYGQDPSQVEFPGGPTAERVLPRSVYPHNARLSFRHNGRIHAAYFDGHIGSMDEAQARTDATPWYPKGSIYTGIRGTADSQAFHAEGEVLN